VTSTTGKRDGSPMDKVEKLEKALAQAVDIHGRVQYDDHKGPIERMKIGLDKGIEMVKAFQVRKYGTRQW
jgi:hypothetical protein